MPTPIDREQVQGLVKAGAQLVEVLPAAEFDEEHLPGAMSIPLGKIDTYARATEGSGSRVQRIGAYLRRDVPTCRLDENVSEVAARAAAAGWDLCLVVNDQNILLGRLNCKELEPGGSQTVDQAMRPGPSTYRPNVAVAEMHGLMTDKGIGTLPVTTSEGLLLGVVCRETLDLAVAAPGSAHVVATDASRA